MTETTMKTHADFILPSSVVTKIDVSRLVSEVERVNDELSAAVVRASAGLADTSRPVLSAQLTEFLTQNQLNLIDPHDRVEIVRQLRLLKHKAPTIHMTFAVTADRESLQKLVQWVRTTAHPQAIIEVGLQPGLVAGVYVRTPNRVHDLSLRSLLDGKHNGLVSSLEALRGSK